MLSTLTRPVTLIANYCVAVFGLCLLTACHSTSPKYDVQRDPGATFSHYQTYAFIETAQDAMPDKTISRLFNESIRTKMNALGYTFSEDNPDLLINYQANIQNTLKKTGNAVPSVVDEAGFYSYQKDLYTDMPNADETTRLLIERAGAARIDIIDADKMQTVWQGNASGSLTEKGLIHPEEPIQRMVENLLKKFPAHKAAQ